MIKLVGNVCPIGINLISLFQDSSHLYPVQHCFRNHGEPEVSSATFFGKTLKTGVGPHGWKRSSQDSHAAVLFVVVLDPQPKKNKIPWAADQRACFSQALHCSPASTERVHVCEGQKARPTANQPENEAPRDQLHQRHWTGQHPIRKHNKKPAWGSNPQQRQPAGVSRSRYYIVWLRNLEYEPFKY